MKHSGLADSPFFPKQPNVSEQQISGEPKPISPATMTPATVDQVDGTNHGGEPNTVIPRHHDTMVETVRLAVKETGKEAATHRFTKREKEAIADIVYAFKRRGIKTSENEIARIAVNFIVGDYEDRGEQSLLAMVLQALNA